ncbi:dehydrodolichyl diphosphate synthase (dedol-pp synthase)-like protein [Leptotrombidium deliense]|uniref:ditrans,polycis-polyprenyl diphosphate synthase [(2E,6E)-farnesyldiphosphate specific] n=1 Tax=Leptotrombidium deliense TaxID=299467 RepID=A0A443S3E2_9ACAR|nr:dehydrodolichyl diphosphate synthase (dedol-pp synthase)-like protein [Leptotrombidium deliense]
MITFIFLIQPNHLHRFALKVLSASDLPEHVVFVINFSDANSENLPPAEKLKGFFGNANEIISWLDHVDIPEVTIYCCEPKDDPKSKTKRAKSALEAINEISSYFPKLINKLIDRDTRFSFFGELDFVPKKLRITLANAILKTKECKKRRINMGFMYTTSDEMDMALKTLRKGVNDGDLMLSDIDENLINRCLYTEHSKEVDLIVRVNTGDNFAGTFLWQQSNAVYTFANVVNYRITFTQFLAALFYAQFIISRSKHALTERKFETVSGEFDKTESKRRIEMFIDKKNAEYINYLNKIIM